MRRTPNNRPNSRPRRSRPPRRARHDGGAGFTLLELLAVLVIAGFILLGVSSATRFGVAAWEHEVRLSGRTEDLDATDRLLRTLLEGMEPPSRFNASQLTQGSGTRLAFIARLPAGGAPPLMRRADLVLQAEPDGRLTRLTLVSRPHLRWLDSPPPPTRTVLASGLAGIAISYWSVGRDGAGAWSAVWDKQGLPALVRVRLAFPAGSGRVWPDIVAAPRREPPQI